MGEIYRRSDDVCFARLILSQPQQSRSWSVAGEQMKCTSQAFDYWQNQSGRGVIVLKCQHPPRPRPLFRSMAAFVHDISRETHGLKKVTSFLNQLLHTVAKSERVVGYTTKCQLAQVTLSSNARCAYGMLFRQREIVANLRGGRDALSLITSFVDSGRW